MSAEGVQDGQEGRLVAYRYTSGVVWLSETAAGSWAILTRTTPVSVWTQVAHCSSADNAILWVFILQVETSEETRANLVEEELFGVRDGWGSDRALHWPDGLKFDPGGVAHPGYF